MVKVTRYKTSVEEGGKNTSTKYRILRKMQRKGPLRVKVGLIVCPALLEGKFLKCFFKSLEIRSLIFKMLRNLRCSHKVCLRIVWASDHTRGAIWACWGGRQSPPPRSALPPQGRSRPPQRIFWLLQGSVTITHMQII